MDGYGNIQHAGRLGFYCGKILPLKDVIFPSVDLKDGINPMATGVYSLCTTQELVKSTHCFLLG